MFRGTDRVPSSKDESRRRELSSQAQTHDKKTFASNLDKLTRMHGMTRLEVAEKIGSPPLWVRRVITRGLARVTSENRPYLEALAELFCLSRPEDLWVEDLVVFSVERHGLDSAADEHLRLAWRQSALWPWARKLGRLLGTGRFEYLKALIDDLHSRLPPDTPEPVPERPAWVEGIDEASKEEVAEYMRNRKSV